MKSAAPGGRGSRDGREIPPLAGPEKPGNAMRRPEGHSAIPVKLNHLWRFSNGNPGIFPGKATSPSKEGPPETGGGLPRTPPSASPGKDRLMSGNALGQLPDEGGGSIQPLFQGADKSGSGDDPVRLRGGLPCGLPGGDAESGGHGE